MVWDSDFHLIPRNGRENMQNTPLISIMLNFLVKRKRLLACATFLLSLLALDGDNRLNAQEGQSVEATEVLKLAIAATGGESKWNEVLSIQLQSRSVTSIGGKISQELDRMKYQKFPDKEWIEESKEGNWTQTVFRSADKNLVSKPGKSRKVFSDLEPDAPFLSIVHALLSESDLLDAEVQSQTSGGFIVLTHRKAMDKYLFDPESKLLNSKISKGFYGEQVTRFGKYATFDGLLFATEIESKVPTADYLQLETLSQIRVNGFIPENVFQMDDSLRSIRVGHPAPAFRFQGLEEGEWISNQSMQGKVTLLDFWAKWCGPCVGELASLTELHHQFSAQGFEVVSISLDEKRETIVDFRKNRVAMAWQNGWLSDGFESDLIEMFEVTSLPKTILIDRDGTVLCVDVDCRGTELKARLEKIFGSQPR